MLPTSTSLSLYFRPCTFLRGEGLFQEAVCTASSHSRAIGPGGAITQMCLDPRGEVTAEQQLLLCDVLQTGGSLSRPGRLMCKGPQRALKKGRVKGEV